MGASFSDGTWLGGVAGERGEKRPRSDPGFRDGEKSPDWKVDFADRPS